MLTKLRRTPAGKRVTIRRHLRAMGITGIDDSLRAMGLPELRQFRKYCEANRILTNSAANNGIGGKTEDR
jgi:hypothetical protein